MAGGRAALLLQPDGPGAREPLPTLCREMPGAGAFAAMAGRGLAQVRATLDGAAALDIEGVHQMRIGLRRVRAPIALFRPCLGPAAAAFDDRLRQAGRALGRARDWDVLLAEALPQARAAGMSGPRIAALADALQTARRGADRDVQEMLAVEMPLLLPALALWAADGARQPALLGTEAWLSRPADATIPGLMTRLRRRVVRRARGHRHASPARLHKLRKGVKTMRYAAEAVAPLYPGQPVGKLVKRCKRLQDELGLVNDAAGVPGLLHALAAPAGSDLSAAVQELCEWAEQRGAAARRHLTGRWHDVRDTARFWE